MKTQAAALSKHQKTHLSEELGDDVAQVAYRVQHFQGHCNTVE